mgnify:CR=1 FL=1
MKNTFLLGVMIGAVGTTLAMQKSKCKAILQKMTKK